MHLNHKNMHKKLYFHRIYNTNYLKYLKTNLLFQKFPGLIRQNSREIVPQDLVITAFILIFPTKSGKTIDSLRENLVFMDFFREFLVGFFELFCKISIILTKNRKLARVFLHTCSNISQFRL